MGRDARCRRKLGAGVRFGILPQVLPNFLSYVLLRFEINVRGATVIGFVGAGGIGQELYSVISFNYYQEIGAIIVLIILTVSAIDLTSERLRRTAMRGRISSMDTPVDIAAMRVRFPRAFAATPLTRVLRWIGGLLFVAWLVALSRLVRHHTGAAIARYVGAVRDPAPDDPA